MAFDPTKIIEEDKSISFTLPTIEVGKTSEFDPTNIVGEPFNDTAPPATKESKDFDPSTAVEDTSITPTRSFVKAAGGSAALSIASTPGMLLGARVGAMALSPFGVPGLIVGGLGGGLLGFVANSEVAEAAFDLLPEEAKATFGYDKKTRQQEIEQNPESSYTGSLTGNFAVFRPGALAPLVLKSAKSNIPTVISPLKQRLGMATVATAFEGINQVEQGKFDPLHLAESAAFGFTAVKPTSITNKISSIISGTANAKQTLDTTAAHNKHQDLVNTPDLVTISSLPEEASIAFNNLNSKVRADTTANVELNRQLGTLGVSKEVSEKLYRYAQETYAGNENINNEIHEIQIKIKELYNKNNKLMNQYDLRSSANPEGKTRFKNLPELVKEEIKFNKERIDEYLLGIKVTESKINRREVLTKEEQSLYDSVVRPMQTQITELTRYLIKEGVIDPVSLDPKVTGPHVSRRTVSTKPKTFFETVKDSLGWTGKLDPLTGDGILERTPAGEQQNLFVLKDSKNLRNVIQVVENNNGTYSLKKWKNGKSVDIGNIGTTRLQAGDTYGRFKVETANTPELELNTPYKYSNNIVLVEGERLTQLRNMVRVHELQKTLLESPEFATRRHKKELNKDIPIGFREPRVNDGASALPKTPRLQGYAFDQRTAEAIEDFNKPLSTSVIGKATNVIVTNLMLVPFVHIMNENPHWVITRGVSGFITPGGIYRLTKTMPEAIRIVNERGPEYQKIMQENGKLMSANIENNLFLENSYILGLKEARKSLEFKQLAKLIGESPFNLYKRLSQKSQQVMWNYRDILVVQSALEKQMKYGGTLGEAVTQVERHLPSYTLPPRVGEFRVPYYVPKIGGKIIGGAVAEKGSRVLSNILQNRNLVVFANYKNGMIGSVLNTVKDIMMTNPNVAKTRQFKEGIDSALAVGALTYMVYPYVMDGMAKALNDLFDTNFDESKFRRGGALHIFDTIKEVAKGSKDQMAIFNTFLTMNPVIQTGIEAVINTYLYSRKEIATPGDYRTYIEDMKNYFIQRFPMMQSAVQAESEWGGGPAQFFFKLFDIKTKTFEQMQRDQDNLDRIESLQEERIYKYENPE
jgi:hypothetical protein